MDDMKKRLINLVEGVTETSRPGDLEVFGDTLGADCAAYEHRNAQMFGVGRIVFAGNMKLSSTARALLNLFDSGKYTAHRSADVYYTVLEIYASKNELEEKQLARCLARLIKDQKMSKSKSLVAVCDTLEEQGTLSGERRKAIERLALGGTLRDVLVLLQADSASNIETIEFVGVFCDNRKRKKFADGFFVYVSRDVSVFQELSGAAILGRELDRALASSNFERVVIAVCRYIKACLRQIPDPELRDLVAETVLTPRALEHTGPTLYEAMQDDS